MDDILNSINGIQKATPKPFMYTRVMAKLHYHKNTYWDKLHSFITKPVVAFGVVLLVLVLNATALLQSTNTEEKVDTEELVVNNSFSVTNYNNDVMENLIK